MKFLKLKLIRLKIINGIYSEWLKFIATFDIFIIF